MKIFEFDGYICKLGENDKENWELFDKSQENNIFLHLSSFPSGYVILEYTNIFSIDMIYIAAKICKDHTKYRNVPNIKVDYCRCSNIIKGCVTGEVIFKSKRQIKQVKL